MRYIWSRLIIIFLIAEIIIFAVYYCLGPRGMKALEQLQSIKNTTHEQIVSMTMENDQLQEQINAWQTDEFLQEKFARERLAMQKEGEIIYFRS